ncbi:MULTISPECIES: AAA-like domain-containing protein [Nostoc]|uniref:AAA-like domain-containing protein n=1 Tax=Nostoc paludosum FACHB-159 TaxID=2692908 RepID=A0ABR8K7E7_9NOSO|nr:MULTISPECIES: AAA-like domain-containing protein [Nostoc]MBD2679040.1 AAA-like domain-containing protein [Nostoc sp. FACHB-857]MBD2735418.1 AAA-like domain-containing protein [Nostoc paludosum FACHB-159]
MNVEAALTLADTLVFTKTGKHISTLEAAIFKGAWSGKTYEEIAQSAHCSETHAKTVGSGLWELLSQGLEEKVTKKNFRAAIERKGNFTIAPEFLVQTQLPQPQLSKQISESLAVVNESSNQQKLEPVLANPTHLETNSDESSVIDELEWPEGQVELNSKFYVERPPLEMRSFQTILKPGSLIRIKAPRQMGKTSLMARILNHAAQQSYYTVTLNCQLADGKTFEDLDLFLKWFAARVTRGLQLPNKIADYWDDIFGSKTSCKDYFEHYLLSQLNHPLVLALEEVDYIFQHPLLADDFFALLRSWHEEAKCSDIWKKLRLVLVHSTEVYIPLNINQSPFNVGLPIELPEFSIEQVTNLARHHGLNWTSEQVAQLMGMVGGHPYLVRVALYYLARHKMTIEELLRLSPTEAGPFNDHLRRHLWNLQQQPSLYSALKKVLETNSPVKLESLDVFKLHSMGLIYLKGNEATPRCQLYRQYFSEKLGLIN